MTDCLVTELRFATGRPVESVDSQAVRERVPIRVVAMARLADMAAARAVRRAAAGAIVGIAGRRADFAWFLRVMEARIPMNPMPMHSSHTTSLFHGARLAALLAAAAGLSACVSRDPDPSMRAPVAPSETAMSNEAPPEPIAPQPPAPPKPPAVPMAEHRAARIVVSPLSQVNRADAARPTIDLRIDSLDNIGAPARSAGEMRILVEAAGAEPAVCAFDIAMATKADEAKHFDAVLDQYVVRLEPRWTTAPARGADIVVTVSLTARTGETVSAKRTMRW